MAKEAIELYIEELQDRGEEDRTTAIVWNTP